MHRKKINKQEGIKSSQGVRKMNERSKKKSSISVKAGFAQAQFLTFCIFKEIYIIFEFKIT